jgi:predicted SnoaL-like aldol condensation-catalyzing enzyme
MTRSDADHAAANRDLVLEMLGRFGRREIDDAIELFHEDFVSHNPRVPHDPATTSGRTAFADFFRSPDGRRLLAARVDVLRVIADSTTVAVHNRITTPEGPELAIVDIFRIQDALIAEHWDVVQPVPAEAANPHGMF